MDVVDIVLGIFILVLALRGLFRGLIKEVFGLLALILGIVGSNMFGKNFGAYIASHISISPTIAYSIGYIIVFFAIYIVLLLIGYIISSILSKIELGWIDRILGFIFGVAKAGFLIAVVVFILESFPIFRGLNYQLTRGSYIYSTVRDIVDRTDVMKTIKQLKHKAITNKGVQIIIMEGKNA